MPKSSLDLAPVTSDWLDKVLASGEAGPAAPLFRAARFAGVAFFTAVPHEPFGQLMETVREKPWVAIVGDDEGTSRGPGSFDRGSLLAACRAATHTAVSSVAPTEKLYSVFALAAAMGGRVLVIETHTDHHAEWHAFVRKHASKAAYLDASTVAGMA